MFRAQTFLNPVCAVSSPCVLRGQYPYHTSNTSWSCSSCRRHTPFTNGNLRPCVIWLAQFLDLRQQGSHNGTAGSLFGAQTVFSAERDHVICTVTLNHVFEPSPQADKTLPDQGGTSSCFLVVSKKRTDQVPTGQHHGKGFEVFVSTV